MGDSPNDEVERRGIATTTNEASLSQSSTSSLAYRRHDPRSLEPIVMRSEILPAVPLKCDDSFPPLCEKSRYARVRRQLRLGSDRRGDRDFQVSVAAAPRSGFQVSVTLWPADEG